MEFLKIIASDNPSEILRVLDESGILAEVFPELTALKKTTDEGHKDNFDHTLQVLDNVVKAGHGIDLRLVAVFHDLGKAKTKRYDKVSGKVTFHSHEEESARMLAGLWKRFELPEDLLPRVERIVKMHGRPKALTDESVGGVRRLITDAGSDLDGLIAFCNEDATTKSEAKLARYARDTAELIARCAALVEADRIRAFRPVLDGHELMRMGFIKHEIKVVVDAMKKLILSGELDNNIESCTAYVTKTFLNK